MKQQYIELIIKQMEVCDDIPLLDLIYKLLRKAGTEYVDNKRTA